MSVNNRGGSFLVSAPDPADVLTPESLGPDYRPLAQAARDFVMGDVWLQLEDKDEQDWSATRRLLRRAGELGFLGIEIPVAFGGSGLDKAAATLVAQQMALNGSFSVTFAVQTGIGSLPIVYFGTKTQKERYVPGLAQGHLIGAFSLTESESGSDALSGQTVARLSDDRHFYILNGTKQWTSNASFADLFVLFAQVDGEKFTAFLVERSFPGVSIGPEERKMGLHGSSTASLTLENALVPVENVLHHVGQGHQVAFNTLNLGRFALASSCLGAAQYLLDVATHYALERQQFGVAIASFPLIQQKLARMAVGTYAVESVVYRVAGLLKDAVAGLNLADDIGDEANRALSEYTIECSIAKVLSTETLQAVVDEAVQIHGGYGFMRGYTVECAYRDSRIYRIFEGTNEINRLLIPQTLLRRLRGGLVAAPPPSNQVADKLRAMTIVASGDALQPAGSLVDESRQLFWLITALLLETHPHDERAEQEVLAILADVAIGVFAMESVVYRARRSRRDRESINPHLQVDLASSFVWDTFEQIVQRAGIALSHLSIGNQRTSILLLLRQISRSPSADRIQAGREIAGQVLDKRGWPLYG